MPCNALLAAVLLCGCASDAPHGSGALVGSWPAAHARCRPVPLRAVRLGGFLGRHVDANNRASIPAGLATAIPRAFEARARGEEPPAACRRLATDSDFFKWLEGACYAIAYDQTLRELAGDVDRYADLIARLQGPDGYLGTRLSPARPFDDKVNHDLYVAGHFIEAAVAHHMATGRRTLLDAARRLANYYWRARTAGHPYFQTVGSREHPEIEPALVRLYRATGEKHLLEFADAITRMSCFDPPIAAVRAGAGSRHAVRLCYLLTGAAELGLETGREGYRSPLPILWDELVTTRLYVTGGLGYNETIPAEPFDLPQSLERNPHRDIAETCASVAMMMFSWRLHAMTGDSRCFDTIETILYNHYLGAVSPDHLGIFYYNPLRRTGDMTGRTDHGGDPCRRTRLPELHSTACCFPNAWRFFAQLPEYVFSTDDEGVLINLFTDAEADCRLPDGTSVKVVVRTDYPHEGRILVHLHPAKPASFSLALRVPGWCADASVVEPGGSATAAPAGRYCRIRRLWRAGDVIQLSLPMEPTVIRGRSEVAANAGQAAFARGPLIYCLEKQDLGGRDPGRFRAVLAGVNPASSVTAHHSRPLGMYLLRIHVTEDTPAAAAGTPSAKQTSSATEPAMLVPFFFRANRDPDARWVTFLPCP